MSGDITFLRAEVAFTYSCNLDCTHCSRTSLEDKSKQLFTREHLLRFAKQFKDQGGESLCFSGGEPLTRKDILFPAIGYAADIGLVPMIISNGHLINEKSVRELEQRGLRGAGISLNGTREVHDSFVDMKGAYDKSLNAIRLLVESKVEQVLIFTVPTDESIANGGFDHVLNVANELGVGVHMNFPTLTGSAQENEEGLLSAENAAMLYQMALDGRVTKDTVYTQRLLNGFDGEAWRKALRLTMPDSAPELRNTTHGVCGNCPAARSFIYVTPYGDVCPCPFIQISFGNFFEMDLAQIKDNIRGSGYLSTYYKGCPPAEDREFIDTNIKPVHLAEARNEPVPVYYADHPQLGARQESPPESTEGASSEAPA